MLQSPESTFPLSPGQIHVASLLALANTAVLLIPDWGKPRTRNSRNSVQGGHFSQFWLFFKIYLFYLRYRILRYISFFLLWFVCLCWLFTETTSGSYVAILHLSAQPYVFIHTYPYSTGTRPSSVNWLLCSHHSRCCWYEYGSPLSSRSSASNGALSPLHKWPGSFTERDCHERYEYVGRVLQLHRCQDDKKEGCFSLRSSNKRERAISLGRKSGEKLGKRERWNEEFIHMVAKITGRDKKWRGENRAQMMPQRSTSLIL